LLYLFFLLEAGQDTVEVVLLDAHLAASSGIVMPGWPFTRASASTARVPLPLRRPARRLVPRALAALGLAAAAFVRVAEPRGRPGPRRPFFALGAAEPRTPARAAAAASRRAYSSTAGFSSLSRSAISRRLSSRKSVTGCVPHFHATLLVHRGV